MKNFALKSAALGLASMTLAGCYYAPYPPPPPPPAPVVAAPAYGPYSYYEYPGYYAAPAASFSFGYSGGGYHHWR